MVSKEEFNKVFKDTSREGILNKFYYEHIELRKMIDNFNELEKYLQNEIHNGRSEDNVWLMGCYDEDRKILDKLQELEGEDKE